MKPLSAENGDTWRTVERTDLGIIFQNLEPTTGKAVFDRVKKKTIRGPNG